MTGNLCTRYIDIDAIIMAGQTDTYYLDIASAVDLVTFALWEGEVKVAEATRMMDLTVMDVYAVHFPDYQVREPVSALALALASITHGHEPFVVDEGEFDETEESASALASSQYSQQTRQGRDETGIEREPLTIPLNGNVGGEVKGCWVGQPH